MENATRLSMSDYPIAEKKKKLVARENIFEGEQRNGNKREKKKGARKQNSLEQPHQIKFTLAVLSLKHHRRSFSRNAYEHN